MAFVKTSEYTYNGLSSNHTRRYRQERVCRHAWQILPVRRMVRSGDGIARSGSAAAGAANSPGRFPKETYTRAVLRYGDKILHGPSAVSSCALLLRSTYMDQKASLHRRLAATSRCGFFRGIDKRSLLFTSTYKTSMPKQRHGQKTTIMRKCNLLQTPGIEPGLHWILVNA